MMRAYLDNNASTRPFPAVVEAVRAQMEHGFPNPGSTAAAVLRTGRDASATCRQALQRLLGTDGQAFVFTSGASEANSWSLSWLGEGMHVVASATEHSSVLRALDAAARRGTEVALVPPDADGTVSADVVARAMRPNTKLVSVMMANNETGVLQQISAIGGEVRRRAPDVLVHTDITQALGRVSIDLDGDLADVDLASFSAHKIHGPRGVGALFVRPGTVLPTLIHGEQEHGRRGGTENSPGIAGFAAALDEVTDRIDDWNDVRAMRDELETELLDSFPTGWINGRQAPRLPNTVSVTIPGVDARELVDRLARIGVCVATGAACHAGAEAPSHVLAAMGLSYVEALSTLRLSLSLDTGRDEIEAAVSGFKSLAFDGYDASDHPCASVGPIERC